jgi:hypothetical protein
MRITTSRTAAVLALSMLVGCDAGIITGGDSEGTAADQAGTDDADWGTNGPMVELSYTGMTGDLMNPERGYYVGLNLLAGDRAAAVRSSGHSLAIALIRLDAYRDAAIPQSMLDQMSAGFADVRANGVKVILRFMYNSSETAGDAPKSRVLQHIAQVKPILQANADVIAVWQGGFIGAWGEWHTSTNGLDNPEDQRDIVTAMLDAMPTSRAIVIRTPDALEASFPGGPISEEEAWTGSDRARLGHHNDCFLSSPTDYGTYPSSGDWKGYVANDSKYTPAGGETCSVSAPRSDCPSATAEMRMLHWSYLNAEYNQDVLGRWDDQGCGEDVERDLGYRFNVVAAAHSESVPPGGELEVGFDIDNTGYAAPYNARPLHVVVRGNGRVLTAKLARDARELQPGTTTTRTKLRLPADLEPGEYQVALWMPDDAASLQDDPRYAIQLATEGVWEAETGYNVLSTTLKVDAAATGPRDLAATEMVEL